MLAFLEFMEPDRMTDAGMYVWAGLITAVSLVASFFVALAWQRWRDSKKENAR